MLKLTAFYSTMFGSNYSSCASRSGEKYTVAAMEALRKKERTG
jgi:hypothetical protein